MSAEVTALRRPFEEVGGFTIGVEEETMLLDPETLALTPVAHEILGRLDGDPRFKAELPAAHVEAITTPTASAADAVAQLAGARHDLSRATSGLARPAVAAVHPTAPAQGPLSPGARYDEIRRRYGAIAHRQLVASLQVHVAVGGADRSLAVYNALRDYLPEIAALASNGPYYEGADSGLASVRPGICTLLPRQGVPPALESWDHYAAQLAWGMGSGALDGLAQWWWELRLHARLGTLEIRVPDAQTTLDEAAGLIAFVQALVATLAARVDAGESLAPVASWRIAENRFSALRYGVEGTLSDLRCPRRLDTRERLSALVDEVEPMARSLGADDLLRHTRDSITRNGAIRQREAGSSSGIQTVPGWLAARYL